MWQRAHRAAPARTSRALCLTHFICSLHHAQDVDSDALRRELFKDHMTNLKRRRCARSRRSHAHTHTCAARATWVPLQRVPCVHGRPPRHHHTPHMRTRSFVPCNTHTHRT